MPDPLSAPWPIDPLPVELDYGLDEDAVTVCFNRYIGERDGVTRSHFRNALAAYLSATWIAGDADTSQKADQHKHPETGADAGCQSNSGEVAVEAQRQHYESLPAYDGSGIPLGVITVPHIKRKDTNG